MTLKDFLDAFVAKLGADQVRQCILRNHEELPTANTGSDLDFLVRPADVPKVVMALLSIEGIRLTGYVERPYVVSIFVTDIANGAANSLQVDLFLSLSWKGLPFLGTEEVLAAARPHPSGTPGLMIPSPVHEAINSFFSSFLIGGWIKQKYQKEVQATFASHREEVKRVLALRFGSKLSNSLLEAVLADDQTGALSLLTEMRRRLVAYSFAHHPVGSLGMVVRHFSQEVLVRHTPAYLDTVCILGPDGAGKSTVIHEVEARLQYTTKFVELRHLKPRILLKPAPSAVGPVTDPHANKPRSPLASCVKLVVWLAELWLDAFVSGKKNLTLRIYDRYFHDLLVDPRRYRYGGPMTFARLVAALVPQPDQWILLDAPTEVLQARKQEVTAEETARQREAYVRFVKSRQHSTIVDASQPLERVAADTTEAILACMNERTLHRIGRSVK